MKLTKIEHLKSLPKEQKQKLLELASGLSGNYYQFLRDTAEKDTYKYEVEIFGTKTRSPGIHASEISKCQRQVVYSIMNTDRRPSAEVDVDMQRRFKIGHAVHAMLQHDMHRMAQWLSSGSGRVEFQDEIRISPDHQEVAKVWEMYSHCDGMFTFYDAQDEPILRVGLEIKTESGPQYDKLVKPRDAHMEQTCFYMAALDLPLMWILYYNKSNSQITNSEPPWLFQFDEDKWKELQLRFGNALYQADIGELPAKEEGMQCGWCPFSWTCQPSYRRRGKNRKASALTNRSLRQLGVKK